MKTLFDDVSSVSSKLVTRTYSTSFSLGIQFLAKRLHDPVYAIYGFVRLADEIVDSFEGYDQELLLTRFREDTWNALTDKISLNPILNSFQKAVHQYQIDHNAIETFLQSMEMDLSKKVYDQAGYEKYILGSAEVVGLMCLRVFVEGNDEMYENLKPYAMKLGSAFQKINFLRDFQSDNQVLGRFYFPQLQHQAFTEKVKEEIEADILADFKTGYEGIKLLPKDARFGVYVAYIYYSKLLSKIARMPAQRVLNERIRISDQHKYALFFSSLFKHSLNLL